MAFSVAGFGQERTIVSGCPSAVSELVAKPVRLTRPSYPPAAIAVRATGDVIVYVTVNPDGKVLKAAAQLGHPLLRKVAEVAASQTTFELADRNCERLAILTYTFLIGPPEPDAQAINSPFHMQIYAKERPKREQMAGKNPCADLKFQTVDGKAPTMSIMDAIDFPECVNGKVIRLYGIYSAGFEGSVFSDLNDSNSAWLTLSPFYPIAKKCSDPEAFKIWNSEGGGTFGFVGYGILRTNGGYGHMNGWDNEFQVMCIDEMRKFSDGTLIFKSQTPKVQKQMTNWWYNDHH
jgi:hypothetical protein